MYYTTTTFSCPKCRRKLAIKITKVYGIRVNSGLGPNSLICSACQNMIQSGDKEWAQMSAAEKVRYLLLSVLYGVLLGFITAIPIGLGYEKLVDRTFAETNGLFYVILPVTLVIILLQMFRVILSTERTESTEASQKAIAFWNWETNLQFYGMLWAMVVLVALGVLLALS